MTERIAIGKLEDFQPGKVKAVDVGGEAVAVGRVGDQLYAVANRCPHLGLPVARGALKGEVITCPWHNSQFNLRTGENIDWVSGVAGLKMPTWTRRIIALGKQPQSLTTYEVSIEGGQVYVTRH